MIDNQRIAAVMFVRNEAQYISEQIESILNQSVEVDRIIIVDDHSTDNTREIIDRYAKGNPKITCLASKKKGKAYALETGLLLIDTDLFFVCAGDDCLTKDYVKYLYFEVLKKYQLDYCYAKYTITDETLKPVSVIKRKLFYDDYDILRMNYFGGYLFGKREILDRILPYPDKLEFEDWYCAIKLTGHYKKSYISEKPVFYYRRHARSATTTSNAKEKYFHLIKRDITFLKIVLSNIDLTDDKKKIVKTRIAYYETVANYTFWKSIPLLFRKDIKISEKIKLLIFPVFVALKYH